MRIVLKVSMEQWPEVLQHDEIDVIYLGSEGCFYKLGKLDELKEAFRQINEAHKQICYATPITQQSHLEEVKYRINTMLDWGIDYVNIVNDLGLLYHLGTSYPKDFQNIFLGRLLNRSIESCPWFDHITRNENDYIKNVMLSNTANMQLLIDYLQNFSVKGIEGNLTVGQTTSLTQLKNKGYHLFVNLDYIYVTSGRVCATAFYQKQKPPGCAACCNNPIDVELSRVRDVFNLKETYFESPEAQKLYGKMIVVGNMVMRENLTPLDSIDLSLFDAVIFDIRNYPEYQRDVLWKQIKQIKNCVGIQT